MRILVDIDEVCAKLTNAWLLVYNIKHKDTVEFDQIKDWDICKFTKVSAEEMHRLLITPKLYTLVKPYIGWVEVVDRLRENDHEIVYVSACVPGTLDDKMEWLLRHDKNTTYKDVVLTYKKYLVNGDILIDDGPHNLEAFGGRTIRFAGPHNELAPANAHAFSWAEIPKAVELALTQPKHVYEG